jgi:hypothetical protein
MFYNNKIIILGVSIMINFLDDSIQITSFSCQGTKYFPIFQTAKFFIRAIQISVPFVLIIWGSIDWFKALIAHDEKEMRMKRKPFVKRVIFAMLILILPWILETITNQVASKAVSDNIWTCYAEAKAKLDFTGFHLDEDSGRLSGTFKSTPSSSSKSSHSADKNVVTNCGLVSGEKNCKNSKTSTNKCKWKTVGTSGGYCTEGDARMKCTEYSKDTCPKGKKDDFGNVCTTGKKNGSSTGGCIIKTDPKKCTQYSLSDCPSNKKDDYGKICYSGQKNGSSAAGCRYKKCTDYSVKKCPSGKKDSEGKTCAKVKEKGSKDKTCGYKK